MSKPVPVVCPKCHGQVSIHASSGGRGTNDLISYRADCEEGCGMLIDHLSDTGRRDSAVREYNRWARSYMAPTVVKSLAVRAGLGAYDGSAKPAPPLGPIAVTSPTGQRGKYLVSGYCLVPAKAELEVEANTLAEALKIAKAEWRRDHRRLLVPHSVDEGSAFDWRPTAEPQAN